MTSRERVLITINHKEPDRVPLYTYGLDPKFIKAFGQGDPIKAFEFLQLDCFSIRLVMWCQGMPILAPLIMDIPEEDQTAGGTYGGWNGVDEFGRIWKRGSCIGGALKTWEDIEKYIPPLKLEERIPPDLMEKYREAYPDKIYVLNGHLGPFGLTLESMGFEHFFYSLYDDRNLVKEVIERRTNWFIEICRYAAEVGADIIVMGDDVAYKGHTYVSPKDFEELAIPSYKRIVDSVKVPVFWHSDGFIEPLIDLAIHAGIKGLQCMEPLAGNDMGRIKEKYGDRLVLIGNVNSVEALSQRDIDVVRRDVERCMKQAKKGGGYMISSDSSLHAGCNEDAVKEMHRYALEIGGY